MALQTAQERIASVGQRYFNVICSTLGPLRSTEPSRYHALSQQRGLSEKKSINAPPDMGLEPMTLRLKV